MVVIMGGRQRKGASQELSDTTPLMFSSESPVREKGARLPNPGLSFPAILAMSPSSLAGSRISQEGKVAVPWHWR